jgi:large subunit ribosomal protein L10
MKLEEKRKIADNLHKRIKKAEVVILTDYKGLNVLEVTQLRKNLGDSGVEYQVVKNTLLTRASKGTEIEGLKDFFKGPSAIAMGFDDPVIPAKILFEFAKDHNKLEIKSGILKGRLLDSEALKNLSELPSREILLSQLLSAMNGVPTGLVRALSDIPRRLVTVLQAVADKKNEIET